MAVSRENSPRSPLLDSTHADESTLSPRNPSVPVSSLSGHSHEAHWELQESSELLNMDNYRSSQDIKESFPEVVEPDSEKNHPSTSFITSIWPRVRIRRRTEIILFALLAVMIAIAAFCAATFATRANAASTSGPTLGLSYGQYQGIALSNGVTQYLGIRYAAPPQRFSAPQPPASFKGVHIADTEGSGCRGSGTLLSTESEDCLFADVYAPTNATSSSKLPVFVFIQGGGLTNALAHANGTGLLEAANNNMVFVSFSYRVGVFGFLASSEIAEGGDFNIGFLDQYQLLNWVHNEIAQFGGDPDHVTLGGQSAGAGSVVNQMAAYGGEDKGLFHAAIMESSSMPPVRNISDQQYQYDFIVKNAGCSDQSDTLGCLRSLGTQDLLTAAKTLPYPGEAGSPVFEWNPVVDGKFVRDTPVTSLTRGNFIKVPTVFGDDTNEGTIFTPQTIINETDATQFIANNFPSITTDQLDELSDMYNLSTPASSKGTYWEKAATAYGETRYTCPGQHMSNLVSTQSSLKNKVWNWRYNVATQKQIASGLGVNHGSEIPAVFGPAQGASSDAKALYATQAGSEVVNHMQAYWVSFIQTYNPNNKKSPTAPTWNSWTGNNRVLFNLSGTTMEAISQDQLNRCGYLAQITLDLRQ